ncbi:YfcE family phosphodiesterase [Candidatus Poriferisodalis sp.]|uniref:YfcE family phosphodiesterase n=1 Tax=Candidatus Poriferisodalis sp. TaxID=3101277 RepID=UPI003B022F9D
MRIGLISDTHIPEAAPKLWPEAYAAMEGCDAILHAGDIYDISVVDRLHEIAPTWAARGNGDDGSSGRDVQPDHPLLANAWAHTFGGVRVGLTHHLPVPELSFYSVADAIARHFGAEERLDVCVYGDTHVHRIDTLSGVLCVNPGSPTFPRNLSAQFGTVGYLDIVDGVATPSLWQLTADGLEPTESWDRVI